MNAGSGLVTAVAAGTANITYTVNGCGGTVSSAYKKLTVNATPSQPGNFTVYSSTVTQGQANVVYTVPNVAGVTYIWSYSGTGATITGTKYSVKVSFSATASLGTFTLSVKASNSCGTSSARTLAITVGAKAPIGSPPPNQPGNFTTYTTSVCKGQTDVVYKVPNVADVVYIWSYSGTGATIAGSKYSVKVSYSATATSGILGVAASNANGTSIPRTLAIDVYDCKLRVVTPTGNGDSAAVNAMAAKNEVNVFPNPTAGPVTFAFQVSENAKVTLDVISMTGEPIARIFDAAVEAEETKTVIFEKSLPPGIYFYNMRWNDRTITGKFIKTR